MHDHKETVRRFYDAIWNNADKTVIPDLLSESFTMQGSLGLARSGRAGFSGYMDFVRNALGEYRCEIVDIIAEGDKVYARMLYSGIHRGELFGHAPTNARIKWDGVAIFTFTDGKIAELWVLGDIHSVIKQLTYYLD